MRALEGFQTRLMNKTVNADNSKADISKADHSKNKTSIKNQITNSDEPVLVDKRIKKMSKSAASEKLKMSPEDIRNKIEARKNENQANKMESVKTLKPSLGEGFLNEDAPKKIIPKDVEAVEGKKTTISVETIEKEPDVGKNHPKDPMTSEKLKSVLDMGAFQFSAKEREVLSQILK